MKNLLTLSALLAVVCFAPLAAQAQTAPPQPMPMAAPPMPIAPPPIAMFPNPQAAQAHCPSDIVVWFNSKKGVYRMPGSPKFGKGGKYSGFACRQEAASVGARQARH